MLGNASEWVLDWAERMSYDPKQPVSSDDVVEPFGAEERVWDGRVMRGGSVLDKIGNLRTSYRTRGLYGAETGGQGSSESGAFRLMCPVTLRW
jgi:formylglycine-generating enzyme required for sulfatase activity